MAVGVCGLGAMGRRLARRLVAAGHEIVGWNRSPTTVPGVRMCRTPAETAKQADVLITMLADPAALRSVMDGPGGLVAGLRPGATLIEMSTVGPTAVRALRARLPAEVDLLDGPIIGSLPQAEVGQLRILVGGQPPAFQHVKGLLCGLGEPVYVGPLGSGAALKLVANACTASLPVLLSDALAVAHRFGVPTSAALDILESTGLRTFVEGVRRAIESGNHPPNFRLALARKDLDLVLSETAGLTPTLIEGAADRLRQAEARGLGNAGFTAVVGDLETGPRKGPANVWLNMPPGLRPARSLASRK